MAISRSVPSTNRLLDVIGLFRGDDRIQVTFLPDPGSVSEPGVRGLLREAGVARVVSWEQVRAEQARTEGRRFSLALAASPKGPLHEVASPLVLMPHGVGHNRLVGEAPGSLTTASGLDPSQLLHDGRIVPDRIALSHAEQVARLNRTCPPAARRGVVVGDPTFDRMLAHLGRRDRYRAALRTGGSTGGGGAGSGQVSGDGGDRRFVVLSSTWNKDSLLGAERDLVRALLTALPVDGYRVGLIAHPNVWYRHGRAMLELWFADEIAAGLILIPPYEGWRAALIAADVVIGDHGSVTFYASALGRPVLLAAFGDAELDPASPLFTFGRGARRIAPDDDLQDQVDRAVASRPHSTADLLIEHQGRSAERMRGLLYGLLGLSEPATAAHYPTLPDLDVLYEDVTAWQVEYTTPAGASGGRRPDVMLRRFPAGAPSLTAPDPDRLLVVDAEDTVVPRWQSAHAWSRRRPMSEREAVGWLDDRLATYPKARLAAAATGDGQALLVDRDGRGFRARTPSGRLDAAVLAAAAAGWARTGRAWHPWRRGVRVGVGDAETQVRAYPPPREFRFLGADG
nr:translation initiation factor IF-2 [Nocardiopsis mwathae]